MALAHLGDRRISRLDDDAQLSDALVRYCSEFYDQARKEALAAHRWTFAKHAVALSRRTDVATIGYSYVHQLPSDILRLMRVVPGGQTTDSSGNLQPVVFSNTKLDSFKIVGPHVWTNSEHLAVEYIRDVENPTEWTPHFRTAVARLLASYLAGPTADRPDEVMNQKRIYETVDLPNAQYYDAVQDQSGENSDHQSRLALSPSLQARFNQRYGTSSTEPTLNVGASTATAAPDLDVIFEDNL